MKLLGDNNLQLPEDYRFNINKLSVTTVFFVWDFGTSEPDSSLLHSTEAGKQGFLNDRI